MVNGTRKHVWVCVYLPEGQPAMQCEGCLEVRGQRTSRNLPAFGCKPRQNTGVGPNNPTSNSNPHP